MKEFQEKSKNKKKRKSKILLLFMAIIFISLSRGVVGTYSKERDSKIEMDRVAEEKRNLEGRYNIISEQSESLKSQIGIETEIRSKFDVVKDGEGVIIIVEKDIPIPEEDKRGVLKRFWDSVTGVFSGGSSTSTAGEVSD